MISGLREEIHFYINEIRKYIAGRTYVFVVDVTIFVTDFYQAQMTITEHKLLKECFKKLIEIYFKR